VNGNISLHIDKVFHETLMYLRSGIVYSVRITLIRLDSECLNPSKHGLVNFSNVRPVVGLSQLSVCWIPGGSECSNGFVLVCKRRFNRMEHNNALIILTLCHASFFNTWRTYKY
jgi:hypothetical protein